MQAIPHELPLQVALPLVGTEHAEHDVPQVAVDVLLSHVPLQSWVPPGHPQPPPWQVIPPVQLWPEPHAPQYVLDVLRFVSQPFEATPSQSPKPLVHDATVQAPLLQPAVASVSEQDVQAAPPVPQLGPLWLV